MAEARNSFIKSKMNKDLDSRIVPSGEYRDAMNVSVSKSEGADVGSLENILGNIKLTDFGLTTLTQQSCSIIGFFMDVNSDRIFVFITNFSDTSADRLSNFAPSFSAIAGANGSECHIGCYDVNTQTSTLIVSGSFLNFSKTQPIYGVNLINDRLFFTDNRNQPRKINVTRAIANPNYYTNEDQISLAKYYPYDPISLVDFQVTGITAFTAGSGLQPAGGTAFNVPTTGGNGTGLTVNIFITAGINEAISIQQSVLGNGYVIGSIMTAVTVTGSGGGLQLALQSTSGAAIIANPGSGYTTGDTVELPLRSSGTNITAQYTLTAASGVSGTAASIDINQFGEDYNDGDVLTLSPLSGTGGTITLSAAAESTMKDVVSTSLPNGSINPFYKSNWPGDKDYLKKRFVRFAYRFQFDDGEYSLISPFTQACFVPEQDGYFVGDDESRTFKSTEVEFMQNKINDIELIIPVPSTSSNWSGAVSDFNIDSIDIIYKDSNSVTLKVLDTIKTAQISNITTGKLRYNYQSSKPYKTLPLRDLLRVYDQTPVRALAQEAAGNRIIYGNFLDKHTPPEAISYATEVAFKEEESGGNPNLQYSEVRKEYQNHSLKQDRNYQVGIVLSDRYGRQSDVILSSIIVDSQSSQNKASTIFNPYKSGTDDLSQDFDDNFSYYNSALDTGIYPSGLTNHLVNSTDTWPGDSLVVNFFNTIDSTFNSVLGTPGLYDRDTNPLGWYSYKIVVKQDQTDYYNTYTAGVLNGYIDGESEGPLPASVDEPIFHFAVQSDNLSKIPKDVTSVGPNQNIFRTGRPSFNEDPSYYQFTNTDGVFFQADPYTEEGEQLLKTRDRERDFDSGSQVENASVKLATRVVNYYDTIPAVAAGPRTRQYYPGTVKEVVTAIGTGNDLGLFAVGNLVEYPFDTAPGFYNFQSNPFIARMNVYSATTSNVINKYGQPGPSPNAAEFEVEIPSGTLAGGTNYPATGGNSIPVVFRGASGTDIYSDLFKNKGIRCNFTVNNGAVNSVTLSNPGEGWQDIGLSDAVPSKSSTATISAAGNADCTFSVRVTRIPYENTETGLLPIFTVFETTPLESKLDIYWESSTAGLISELNTQITASDNTTPAGFSSYDFTNQATNSIVWFYPENLPINNQLNPTAFYATNSSGLAIHQNNGAPFNPIITLVSAVDALGNDVTSTFSVVPGPTIQISQPYIIRNLTNRYFGASSASRDVFTFNLNVNSASATYALDQTTTNTALTLSLAPGLTFPNGNLIPQPTFPLFNITPPALQLDVLGVDVTGTASCGQTDWEFDGSGTSEPIATWVNVRNGGVPTNASSLSEITMVVTATQVSGGAGGGGLDTTIGGLTSSITTNTTDANSGFNADAPFQLNGGSLSGSSGEVDITVGAAETVDDGVVIVATASVSGSGYSVGDILSFPGSEIGSSSNLVITLNAGDIVAAGARNIQQFLSFTSSATSQTMNFNKTAYSSLYGTTASAGDIFNLSIVATDGGGLSSPVCTARLKVIDP